MPRPELQILVCLNERSPDAEKPSCAPRGSLAVYHRFKDRVKELGLRDRVMVNRTGCLKHCSRGITVAVQPLNLWYAGVTSEDVDEILEVTVLGHLSGQPPGGSREVARLRMPDIPWE
jgi:(2Fe-2S) ferredoxin